MSDCEHDTAIMPLGAAVFCRKCLDQRRMTTREQVEFMLHGRVPSLAREVSS